jgi:hypothetical protein
MRPAWMVVGLALLLLVGMPGASAGSAHYIPRSGDSFGYHETITLTNGVGNYTGYSESASYDGSITVNSVAPNGTEGASYQSSGRWSNNQGQSYPWSESGSFTFSVATYHYVQGTDNQTGYVNPFVWFYMNNSLGKGASFFVLNTQLTIVSTSYPFADSLSSTGYVQTIFAEGNGTYQRSDVYGKFTASYNYQGFFDPSTGYIVGYIYTETDSDASGDGFTWTDTVADSRTTFPLTNAAAPPPPITIPPSQAPPLSLVVLTALLTLGIVVGVVLAVAFNRRRQGGMGRTPLPRHVEPGGPGLYAPPPPIDLTPRDQPTIQQVVMRETVKVPCRFCGTLIDSTATVCPKCGAPRT